MANLVGLENTAPVRRAYMVRTAAAAIRGLKKRRAVSSADDYGAIHAYMGRDGFYRCEAMRWMHTEDTLKSKSLTHVRSWYSTWLKKIAVKP